MVPYNPPGMEYGELPSRLATVRERIAAACARSGRDPAGVTIVAVTKTHGADAVEAALGAGIRDIAENRVQELETKVVSIGRGAARWHLIGHLQRNKARRALDLADLIHSIDSLRLAERLGEIAGESGRTVEGLVQVNVSGEATKGGFDREEALERIAAIAELPGLRIVGLMTMAPLAADERLLRAVFGSTRELSAAAAASCRSYEPRHLSMGMSGDFEVAVEEGSTLVRLGTVLLGEREE